MLWSSAPALSKAPSPGTEHGRPLIQSESTHGTDLDKQETHELAKGDSDRQELANGSPAEEQTLERTAIALANSDLKKAMEWLAQIQDPESKLRATLAIGNEAIRSNPMVALNLVAGLKSSPQRDDLIRRGVAEWALSDASSAKEWALQIEDETLRTGAVACIATSWSNSSPVAAANLVIDELPEGRLQSDTLVSIIQRWAQTSPKAAASWVEQFPEGDLKKVAAKNLIAVWSSRDAVEAGRWSALLVNRK